MLNFQKLLASAVLLGMALSGLEAHAKGAVTAPLADYNSAQVATANGTIVVPFGGILANAIYTVAVGTQLQIGSNFTIALPSGFSFGYVPAITGPGGGTIVSLQSGGAGQNFCTYLINGVAVGAGQTLSVGVFTATGATALGSQFSGNVLNMTFQATNNATSTNNDASPISVPVFTHAVGSLPDTITPGSGQINLGSSPPGTQFVSNGATIAGSGQIATFAVNVELNDPFNSNAPVLKPNGTANSLTLADTANVTVSSNNNKNAFVGIATAYASPTVTTCASTVPPGAIAGTIGGSSITFNGVPINTPVQMCMIPNGTTLLEAGNQPYVFTYTAGSSTDFFGGLSQTTAGNFYTYNGSVLNEVVYTALSPGYPFYLRFVNDMPFSVTLAASVKADNGNYGDTSLTLPGNSNMLLPGSTILQNAGVTLDSTGRASIVFVTLTPSKVSVEQLLISPDGTLTQIN